MYGCANDFLNVDRSDVINSRGCRDVMYSWYRAGFIQNIIMAIIGIGIGAFQFYLYTLNRREYYKILDELDDMRKPMMNTTMSMSTINSKMSGGGPGSGHMINFGPKASVKYSQKSAASINENIYNNSTTSAGATSGGYLPQLNTNNFSNPLQSIQNMDGRFSFKKPPIHTPSNRFLIEEPHN